MDTSKRPRAAEIPSKTQGERKLSGFDSKYLHQVVDVPSGHSSSHGDAFFFGLLLEDADREAFQPRQIVGGKAITDSTVILSERHVQAPVQTVFDAPVAATASAKRRTPTLKDETKKRMSVVSFPS